MTHKWTYAEIERLKQLWKRGFTKYEVAATLSREYGFICTHSMVMGMVSREGLLRKNGNWRGQQDRGFIQLGDFGASA